MRLSEMRQGGAAVVREFDAGHRASGRLVGMGLAVGSRVDIVSGAGGGPLVVAVGQTRLALGRGLAAKVVVEPLEGSDRDGRDA